jgi:SAM-dependent methyltransferase
MVHNQPVTTYTLDNAVAVTRLRFDALAATLDPLTFQRLTSLGVGAGWRCLEVGTGGGSVARWLAERVGPAGHVLATDLDLRWTDPGPHANLELRRHDITVDPLPDAAFDLVYARLVLVHLPERYDVLDRLVRALAPGGVLLVEEFEELLPAVPDPDAPHAALSNRVREAFIQFFRQAQADNTYPRTLPRLLAARGLEAVQMEGNWVFVRGGSIGAALDRANLLQLRPQLVGTGLLTDAEVDAYLAVLDDPVFLGSLPLLVAGHGRRPAAGERPPP